jgi:hypothetical protein
MLLARSVCSRRTSSQPRTVCVYFVLFATGCLGECSTPCQKAASRRVPCSSLVGPDHVYPRRQSCEWLGVR